tara:strand:- start:848 stop:1450 length:603 start_codon:yes stop_codon:yes gene_type:complete
MNDMTTENLDRVAKALQDDLKPQPDYHKAWCERLNMLMCQLIDHFEDGNDVIIQAKLGDQLPRMFEKMRDNVANQGQKVRRERASAIRNDVGIEITQNTIDDLDEKLERLRVQYWTLNESFKVARDKTRSHATSTSGISFGSYQTLAELPRMRRVKMRKNQLTMETYMANQHHFWDFARDTGLVEKPSDYDYGSKDFTLE